MALIQSAEIRKAHKDLDTINFLEKKISKLTDQELAQKTAYFKDQLAQKVSPSSILCEAFAVAREAIKRKLGKRLFNVQIIGSLLLNAGAIAEMKTGEGKTLASIPAVYFNALSGKSVVVVTVNEYLTQRDAEETGEVYNFLGLTVGVNLKDSKPHEKRAAYKADITYSIHSEVGFDYLRDNMVKKISDKVQRPLHFAVIDEADSILIDEAKTPLIISGNKKQSVDQYLRVDVFVKGLSTKDYEIDSETHSIHLTKEGVNKANSFFKVPNIYDIKNSEIINMIQNSLRAHYVIKRGAEYIIKDGEIVLVDAFTGRTMEGRSYSDGLHQAIQSKEKVEVTPENATLATITYQNLFRMFKKLSGMTGTAKTEEEEFIETYNTKVFVVPTNRPNKRTDHPDVIYANYRSKMLAVRDEIIKANKIGQPILVGTAEIIESEYLSKLLKEVNLSHTVLNAKQNEKEAEIIAKAGESKAITIATNMAGRGTDIKPSSESLKVGGLYVIGTNRAEARRIDNQLRGRSGRQGDVGKSKFFISLEDTLIKRFSNAEKLAKSFPKTYTKPITNRMLHRSILRAQLKIEGFNFDLRKNVLQYDDVIRQQRDVVYSQRDIIISQEDLDNVAQRMMQSVVKDLPTFSEFQNDDKSLNIDKLVTSLNRTWFSLVEFKLEKKEIDHQSVENIIKIITNHLLEVYQLLRQQLVDNVSENGMHQVERQIILTIFDRNWEQHIDRMSKLRSSTSLASYAQKNPYQVYVEEGTKLFNDFLQRIAHNVVRRLMQNPNAMKRVAKSQADLSKQINRAATLNSGQFNSLINQRKPQVAANPNQPNVVKKAQPSSQKPQTLNQVGNNNGPQKQVMQPKVASSLQPSVQVQNGPKPVTKPVLPKSQSSIQVPKPPAQPGIKNPVVPKQPIKDSQPNVVKPTMPKPSVSKPQVKTSQTSIVKPTMPKPIVKTTQPRVSESQVSSQKTTKPIQPKVVKPTKSKPVESKVINPKASKSAITKKPNSESVKKQTNTKTSLPKKPEN